MSISFAAPPRIVREGTPPLSCNDSSTGSLSSALAGSANSARTFRKERHDSQSSLRSNASSDTAVQRRTRSPQHKRFEKKRVSFSTLDNEDANMISLTLRTKHEAYKFSRRSRCFIIGYNDDEYSKSAMEWLVDTMVDDGDEIIALRVIEPKVSLASDDTEEKFRQQAKKMQQEIIRMNIDEDKELSIIVELAVGNIKLLLLRLIHLYHPDSLIVGTKGRSLNGLSGLKPNSISKWCLQNSPVPVIVVRPDRKRDKAKKKRMQDPSRRSYLELLENSSSFEDLSSLNSTFGASTLSQKHLADGPGSDVRRSLDVTRPSTSTSSASSRDSRHLSANPDKERSRGKSPLGRLTHRVSKVFGDN